MLSEAGNSLEENELASIAFKIAQLNRRLAEQFERGPQLLERRDAAAAKRAAAHSHAKMAQFRSIIDEYVLKFSDAPMRFAGGIAMEPNANGRRASQNSTLLKMGSLPNGSHQIKLQLGGRLFGGYTRFQ